MTERRELRGIVQDLARSLGCMSLLSVSLPGAHPLQALLVASAGGAVRDLNGRVGPARVAAGPRNERFVRGDLTALVERLPPAVRAALPGAPRGALALLPVPYRGSAHGLVLALRPDGPFDRVERGVLRAASRQASRVLELREALQRAREALQARDQFLGLASHELSGPLATASLLATAVELTLERAGHMDARSRSALRSTRLQLERASGLVRRLADAARRTRQAPELQPVNMDLAEVVGTVVSDLRLRDARGRTLELRLGRRHLYGRWDREQLEQVIDNLLSNALKFGAGRPVQVSLDRVRGGAELRVKDQGIGIRRSDQARIFQRFTRAVPHRQFPGLGLGLWLVKEIVASHHGEMSVISEPGKGSEFVVWLPGAGHNGVKLKLG